jgi:hypothetical protein
VVTSSAGETLSPVASIHQGDNDGIQEFNSPGRRHDKRRNRKLGAKSGERKRAVWRRREIRAGSTAREGVAVRWSKETLRIAIGGSEVGIRKAMYVCWCYAVSVKISHGVAS